MTSKEILQHIKNAPSFKGGDSRYMSTSNSAFLYDQDIDTIEKDLEVLEILKNEIGELKMIVKQERDFIDMLIAEIDKEKYEEWSKTHPIENLDKEIEEGLDNE